MRVAALYDVHGNLPALEAVLAELEREDVDLVLVGGDIVAGPLPRETLDRLRALGDRARFIRGNADREVLAGGWAAEQLDADALAFLAELPEREVIALDGLGPTLFCHGSPRSDEEIVTRISSPARLRPMLDGVAEGVVVSGHTHVQFDRTVDSFRLVNPGSVGLPYEGRPGAYWALLGPRVSLRRTEYDTEAAAARIRASRYPEADALVADNILRSPPAEEATEYFERLASGAS